MQKIQKSAKNVNVKLADYIQDPLLELYKNHYYIVFELVKLCQVSLCIIGQKEYSGRNFFACLLDTRHLENLFPANSQPVYWIIDMDTGAL